jgi:hypothetical protein
MSTPKYLSDACGLLIENAAPGDADNISYAHNEYLALMLVAHVSALNVSALPGPTKLDA